MSYVDNLYQFMSSWFWNLYRPGSGSCGCMDLHRLAALSISRRTPWSGSRLLSRLTCFWEEDSNATCIAASLSLCCWELAPSGPFSVFTLPSGLICSSLAECGTAVSCQGTQYGICCSDIVTLMVRPLTTGYSPTQKALTNHSALGLFFHPMYPYTQTSPICPH